MIAAALEERVDGWTTDIFDGLLEAADDLSHQEIELGLRALHCALYHKRLPFVVLVEDDDSEAELFRLALRAAGGGVELMHFQDGQQAIDFFNGKGRFSDREEYPLPQLTVLDLKLTRRSGLQILQEIRATPQLEQLVVVAFTGSNDRQEIERARSLSIDGWFSKPKSFAERVRFVRSLLKTWLPT